MKKTLIALPVAATMLLASCSQTSVDKVITFVDQVQQATIAVCNFVPTASAIANIIDRKSTRLNSSH